MIINEYEGNVYDYNQEPRPSVCIANFVSCIVNTGVCGLNLEDCKGNASNCGIKFKD